MNKSLKSWRSYAIGLGVTLAIGASAYALTPAASTTSAPAVTKSVEGPGYLDCDGTRYMEIPHDEAFDVAAGGSITVSAKVWLDSYGAHRGIVCNRWHDGTANSQTTGYDIYGGYSSANSMSNNVNLYTGSWNNLGHPWCNTLTTGEWAVVTWVYNGEEATSKMYLDGVLKDTRTNNNIKNYPLNPQTAVLVGARYDITDGVESSVNLSTAWKGKITDVRFYSRALTDAEVVADMTAEVDATTPDLIAAYDFKTISGFEVSDISGNGHTGLLVGFPAYVEGSPLTIVQPMNGTIKVYDGEEEVINSQNVPDGTELTIEATPSLDYLLAGVIINGEEIEGNTFVMNGATTVTAVFERDPEAPTKVLVFDMDEDGSKYYRIPALEVAADGSLVALADRRGSSLSDLPNTISIVAKRSTDGGETWSQAVTIAQGDAATGKTYGDPAIVLDRNTNDLVAVFAGDQGFWASTKANPAGFYVSRSSDNGVTWSEPENITSQIYQSNWYGSFCASGSLLQTADGRIMFVANTRITSAQWLTDVYEFVCCSEDGGHTWSVLNADSRIPAPGNGNESKLVETSDGTLIMSIRSSGARRFAKSTDGGYTWSTAEVVSELVEPDCNGDIIVYPSTDGQTRMLHSLPANASTRRDVAIYMSYDEGETWPVKKQLLDTYSAYSSLAVLHDGTIGCFVEEGKWDSNIPGEDGFRLYFMKFDLNWLTDGADTGNGELNSAHTVSIETPSVKEGILEVFAGEEKVTNGMKINDGTELTVVATPNSAYIVKAFILNGETIEGIGNELTFTLTADVTIGVEFMVNPDMPLEYCVLTGNATRTDVRGLTAISVSDSEGNGMEIEATGTAGNHELYADRTASVFITKPGATISIRNIGSGTWMSTYVYVDYDNSATFDFDDAACSGASVDGELVAHTGYDASGADPTVMSDGTDINWQTSYNCAVPSFTLPADLAAGDYRVRHKIDWNCTDPCGRTSANGYFNNFIEANGGCMLDFIIRIEADGSAVEAIGEDNADAPAEYYNLQGVKVNASTMAPGIYIMVKGDKATKVTVK